MGYDLHITRKANWFDEEPKISLQEWEAVAQRDPMLWPEGTISWTINGKLVDAKIFALRERGNRDDIAAALYWDSSGDVSAKNPRQAGIAHMASIAARLNARVQGDDGEYYDAQGNQIRDQAAG